MTRTLTSGALAVALTACVGESNPDQWAPHARALTEWEAGLGPGEPEVKPPPYVPLRDASDRPEVTVFGYWPYWGDPLSTMPWDQLTHVAIFNVELRSDGTLANTSRWTGNAPTAMALAAPHGVKVQLCVTSFDDAVMTAVLGNAGVRATAVANLKGLVDAQGANGVNVDFEGLPLSQKANFVAFVQQLNAAVPEVTLAMPAVDWAGAYDFDQLAFASHGLFIMGYDYHWSGGDPGPVAPLFGSQLWGQYSLEWSLDDYRTWGAPDASLIMGLPLYGRGWDTVNNDIPGDANGGSWSALYSDAIVDGEAYGRHYDVASDTAYAFPDAVSQLWYDDQVSLDEKIAWAVSEGIQGIGFWAMTYENSDPSFWAMVDAHTHDGMSLSAPDPGLAGAVNQLVVRNAAPSSNVTLVVGVRPGSTTVPGCPGVEVDMDDPRVLLTVRADAEGTGVFEVDVPGTASGRTGIFQVGDPSRCAVSNPVSFPFG